MPVFQYVRLDVFTDQAFTGIQLAVFLDAAGIDERRTQRIANEMALPETSFVLPPEAPGTDARVRIFTPPRSCLWPGLRQSERPLRSPVLDGCLRAPIRRCSASISDQ